MVLVSVWIIDGEGEGEEPALAELSSKLYRTAVPVLHQILLGPKTEPLAALQLENILLSRLISFLKGKDSYLQVYLLDVLLVALKLSSSRIGSPLYNLKQSAIQSETKNTRLSLSLSDSEKSNTLPPPTPPALLVKCLIGGFSSTGSKPVLDNWVNFLAECLPLLSEVIFQILIPLVECIIEQIRQCFQSLQSLHGKGARESISLSENNLATLLNGLEQVLAAAHDKLMMEEVKHPYPKNSAETNTGFFGNMVSGVFNAETSQARNAAANNRLTVLLCFQDTVRICYSIWSWGDQANSEKMDAVSLATYSYTSMKLRSRSRRLLEHMFAAETLECLETLIQLWTKDGACGDSYFKLINVLDGSRPKYTIPAMFNAIHSRTNPSALEPYRKSTLTTDLTDLDIVVFLVEYAVSLEDDAMDEIWAECMSFIRDVLANPFPHRQSLPSLLQFVAILGEKVANTNFGEQKKLRKELGVREETSWKVPHTNAT